MMDYLETIQNKLLNMFVGKTSPEILLLPENQMIISKNMVPNLEKTGLKDMKSVPALNGYRIYVAYRTPNASMDLSAQRIRVPSQPIVWDPNSMKMQVDQKSLTRDWRVLNHEGKLVNVTVHCGSGVEVDEVNMILTVIAEILLL